MMAVSPAAALTSSSATAVLGFQGLDVRCRTPVGCGLALPMRASVFSPGWSHGRFGSARVLRLGSRAGVACVRTGASASASLSQEQEPGKSDGIDVLEAMEGDASPGMFFLQRAMLTVTAGLGPMLLDAPNAMAAGGEFGILEGRSFALFHPIVMGGLFLYTLYAGYLGWQWRSVRTVQEEINELKKQLPAAPAEGAPAPPSPVASKIQELTEYRKELVKGGFRDKHFNAGSILLAFGVFEAVGGAVNTWFRTGKLFPGPHLFAGAGITVLWALSAALVPAMQKGNETARTAHITLNVLNVLLFIWQIPTGWEIVGKVFEFTTWP